MHKNFKSQDGEDGRGREMETLQETLLHRQYRFDTGYIVLGISDSLFKNNP